MILGNSNHQRIVGGASVLFVDTSIARHLTMGNNISASSFLPCLEPPKPFKIIVHGLHGAGKTSFIYCLKLGEIVSTIPTIGFNVETLKFQGQEYVGWDVGGRDKMRPLFRHFYHGRNDFRCRF